MHPVERRLGQPIKEGDVAVKRPTRFVSRDALFHEIPAGVHLGRGALVDAVARLGIAPTMAVAGAADLTIGREAVIRAGAAVYSGCVIGHNVDIGFNVVIHEGTIIGDSVRLGENSVIGPKCTIGDRVRIDSNCSLAGLTTVQDDAHLLSGVSTANDPHPGSRTQLCARGPVIGPGAQVGTNATILPFVTIGERAMVVAGSVVTEDVRPHVVVGGSPARRITTVADVCCPLDLVAGEYLQAPVAPAS